MRMIQDDLHRELLRNEISSLTELKGSKHVLKLLDVFSTSNNTYIITELCDGKDLTHMIQTHKGLRYLDELLKRIKNYQYIDATSKRVSRYLSKRHCS
jgi:serine/threonine protein kinase